MKQHNDSLQRSVCVIGDYDDDALAEFGQDVNFSEIATELACNLDVPVCSNLSSDSSSYTHALVVIPYSFGNVRSYAVAIQELVNSKSKKSRRRRPSKKPTRSKPFFVDFLPPSNSRLGKRFEGQSGTDLLIKATSPKDKTVYDLTAGFGQDSLLMASQGGASRVVMVERDNVVAAILSDALRRLNLIASDGDCMDPQTQQRACDLSERLSLTSGDAVQVAKTILNDTSAQRPDVCYVDPMFPSRRKSAAVKKNMQILHGLLGSQSNDDLQNDNAIRDEQELLEAALSLACHRVVVKRPISTDYLGGMSQQGIKPSYEIKGSVNRWDVYLK